MRKMKKWMAAALTAAMVLGISGCGAGNESTENGSTGNSIVGNGIAGDDSVTGAQQEAGSSKAAEGTRVVTDSAGRQVEIPSEIKKIAPSGPLAQIVLYTVSPDKLAGLAADFSDEAKLYIDERYWRLPQFGQFYGKNASLNMEALIAEAPDVIIDIGESKKTVKEDMDALQEQLNIPVLFVEATLPTMADAYTMLGDITGEKEQARKLAEYCETEITKTDKTAAGIAQADKKSVYFALGDDGLHTNAKGSIHADVIERVGALNAADVEAVSNGGGSEVSFEQVLLWNPDVIIADSAKLYDTLTTDEMWKELDAVKEGRIYKIPTAPYSFMSSPPSVNRIIGIEWLGHLVYPEQYDGDVNDQVKAFYKLFYHVDVNDGQMKEILKNSLSE